MTPIPSVAAAAALAAALGFATLAAADAGHGRFPGAGYDLDFSAIDTDGDATLSRGELTARATERLDAFDTDGNGLLDRAEIAATMPVPRDGLRNIFGPNRSDAAADRVLAIFGASQAGEVAVEAMATQRVDLMLSFLDQNDDNAISQDEAEASAPRGDRSGRDARSGHGEFGRGHDGGPASDAPRP
jgi:Ca2+-binding EF-hand superfamily protein